MRFLFLSSFLLVIFGIPAAAFAGQPAAAVVSVDAAEPSGGFVLNQEFVPPTVTHTNGVHLPDNVVLDQIPPDHRAVVLQMSVDEKGYPQKVRLVSSRTAFLDLPVYLAAEQFRFKPARLKNEPVPSDVRLVVEVVD